VEGDGLVVAEGQAGGDLEQKVVGNLSRRARDGDPNGGLPVGRGGRLGLRREGRKWVSLACRREEVKAWETTNIPVFEDPQRYSLLSLSRFGASRLTFSNSKL